MASCIKRKNRFCIVYSYTDKNGLKKQRWETFRKKEDALERKAEIERRQNISSTVTPQCRTIDDLLNEYVELYGKNTWAVSTFGENVSLIKHYIRPLIGNVRLEDVTTRIIEKYYTLLLKTPSVGKSTFGRERTEKPPLITPRTVKSIHKLLRSCFNQAVKWDLMEKNPCSMATVPKSHAAEREIWDAETLFRAIDLCTDEKLKLAMNLAFCCTLRMGEMLALTWDCVDISQESIAEGCPSVTINKELERTSKGNLKELDSKDVFFQFPAVSERNSTVIVFKSPKTASSVRQVYMPVTVAQMLAAWKQQQDEIRKALGKDYKDYNLVFAGPEGMPTEGTTINKSFRRLIAENNLPPVVFHSMRHTSITYKLKLSGGDIKSVQGDSGHAQSKMVTDQYSHILDADRKVNARNFEREFYSGKNDSADDSSGKPATPETPADIDSELLRKLLQNPEMASLLKSLAKNI